MRTGQSSSRADCLNGRPKSRLHRILHTLYCPPVHLSSWGHLRGKPSIAAFATCGNCALKLVPLPSRHLVDDCFRFIVSTR